MLQVDFKMDFSTTETMINAFNISNDSEIHGNSTTDDFYNTIVQLCISVLLVCCLLAVCVNGIVIFSIHWIRTPMTPNLKISISLAIADATSSSMTGLMLLFDTLNIVEDIGVFCCIIELIRLSGIVITVLHLLALSINHYIGIMKPLHYNVIVTKRKVLTVISFLWISPFLLVLTLSFVENNGLFLTSFQMNTCNAIFTTFTHRFSYSILFFFPIVLMVIFYTHILIAVRNQQNKWKNLSRNDSTRSKGRSIHGSNQKASREQARLQGNIKAINTTLFILGSCFIGWMPALLFFILTCEDCPISGETLKTLNINYKYEVMTLRLMDNMLVIMKMLANPIIYTIRIKEIKVSI